MPSPPLPIEKTRGREPPERKRGGLEIIARDRWRLEGDK